MRKLPKKLQKNSTSFWSNETSVQLGRSAQGAASIQLRPEPDNARSLELNRIQEIGVYSTGQHRDTHNGYKLPLYPHMVLASSVVLIWSSKKGLDIYARVLKDRFWPKTEVSRNRCELFVTFSIILCNSSAYKQTLFKSKTWNFPSVLINMQQGGSGYPTECRNQRLFHRRYGTTR